MSFELVYGEEDRLLPWAAKHIGIDHFRRDAYAIGLKRYDELIAVVVFDNYTKFDVCMSVAASGSSYWANSRFMAAVFAYPYTQLGMRRVTAMVASKNRRSADFVMQAGFKQEGLCRNALADDDLLIFGMLREECRFLPKEP